MCRRPPSLRGSGRPCPGGRGGLVLHLSRFLLLLTTQHFKVELGRFDLVWYLSVSLLGKSDP